MQRYTPARAYPYEKLVWNNKKGGLDFVWYAFNILEKLLIPYYEEIRHLNPSKTIHIVEDSVGLHHKARRLLADTIFTKNVLFINHSANSPDLEPCETLHKIQKK